MSGWKLRPTDPTAAAFYGLPKIHKVELTPKDDHFILNENVTSIPTRPINSCIGSPIYSVSKYLAKILKPLERKSTNTVKNSKEFSDFVSSQVIEHDETVVSFDVVSLFTSIPIQLAIEVVQANTQDSRNIM